MDLGQDIITALNAGLSDDATLARVREQGHDVSKATVRWYRNNINQPKGKANAKIKVKKVSRRSKAVKSKRRARH